MLTKVSPGPSWIRRIQFTIAVLIALAASVAAETPRPVTIVAVIPGHALTAPQYAAMAAETDAIWRASEVRILWQGGPPTGDKGAEWVVSVHLVDRLKLARAEEPEPLGTIITADGRMRRALIVSRAAVKRLVESAGLTGLDKSYDHIYGRMVGRVIAHELGHLLLGSSGHRDSGLMRARFERRDVLVLGRDRFKIAGQDRVAIGLRWTVETSATASGPVASREKG